MQRILRRSSDAPPEDPSSSDAPAGVDPETPSTPSTDPGFRERGRLRRRLRYLRRARELAYRDLGGLVFDLRRFERDRSDLVEAKLEALTALDRELRALESALDDRRAIHLLREPGISACPRCGAMHSSHDRYCPACGNQLQGEAAAPADQQVTQTFTTPAGE